MSEKRTSSESRDDEQTNEEPDVSRQVDNGKREKLASFSNTTLQDIPIEILQCILIKAVAMEVQNMKLAKSVWKEKAELVISRLGSVCSQWNIVLTTNFFQMELHKALDGIAEVKIRMEIVQEFLIAGCYDYGIDTLKDDIFLFRRRDDPDNTNSADCDIIVYDRNIMAEVKDVIEIPGLYEGEIAACNVSNCIYILTSNFASRSASVFRITKDTDQKFNIHPWISDLGWSVDSISLSAEGRVILRSTVNEQHVISFYTPNGLLHHEIISSLDVHELDYLDNCVIVKSNGNLVLGSVMKSNGNLVLGLVNEQYQMLLTEIDSDGAIQRKYTTPLDPINDLTFLCFADAFGRILIRNTSDVIELLDSELNLLKFTGPQSDYDEDFFYNGLHFDSERNEVIGLIRSYDTDACRIKIFRFLEE